MGIGVQPCCCSMKKSIPGGGGVSLKFDGYPSERYGGGVLIDYEPEVALRKQGGISITFTTEVAGMADGGVKLDFVPTAHGKSHVTADGGIKIGWTATVKPTHSATPVVVNVPAKACIWFAWTPDGEVGPVGETPIADYRPVPIDVPAGALSVSLTATGAWTNRTSGPLYGPDGRDLIIPLLNLHYQDGVYQNGPITGINTHMIRLVAIWQIGTASPGNPPVVATTEFDVGSGLTDLPVPAGATRLLLAAHDSRNWVDNRGSVDVTAIWRVPN